MADHTPWDPALYDRYADARSRPFVDLLNRVGARAPREVVDLGCGPGTLTATLARRWPDARVTGIDSSPDMLDAAAPLAGGRLAFELGDLAGWSGNADVVVSNAALQWVPDHLPLLAAWAAALPADGWLAVQMPTNFAREPYTHLRDPAAEFGVQDRLIPADAVAAVTDYATVLGDAGLEVDAWETTYVHVLQGPDPVLEWLRGAGLRPVLAALSDDDRERFLARLRPVLAAAYPRSRAGTFFPFRRVFVVGHRP